MSRMALMAMALTAGISATAFAQSKPPAQAPGAPAPGPTPSLIVQNSTPNIVNNVFISLTTLQSWGQDQLGASEVIRAGASRSFDLPAGECLYDIRVVYQGNVAEERRRVDACNDQNVVLPMAGQRLTLR